MLQQVLLIFGFLTTFILFTNTTLLAQSKIEEKGEWYRPGFAAANVDTVKIRSGGPVGDLPYSREIIATYNKHGYITSYESAYFGQHSSEHPYRVESNSTVRRIWQHTFIFSYDGENRLTRINIRNNHMSFEGNLGITIRHLKKHGGSLPDYYEKALKDRRYEEFRMQVHAISFTYDADGKPANQLIEFEVESSITLLFHGGSQTSRGRIIGEGRKSVRETLIFPNHDLVFKHQQEYMNQNYFSYSTRKYFSFYNKNQQREKKYLNCKNIDLNDKWLWHKNLEDSMCPDTAAVYGNGKNLSGKPFPIISFYDQSGKLILRNTTHYFFSEPKPRFNCAEVTKTASIRHYKYDLKDQLLSETSYLIYKLLPGSKYPIPFCAENPQVMQSLPENHFLVEHYSTTYQYYSNGLLKQEEYDTYDYSNSENGYYSCDRLCFPLNKHYVRPLLTNYSYTYHSNQ